MSGNSNHQIVRFFEKVDGRLKQVGAAGNDSIAPDVVADAGGDTVRFLEDIALEVPYSKYFGRLRVQVFERLRALVISDVFEDVTEATRAEMVAPYTLEALRGLPEYQMLRSDIEHAAATIATGETADQWIDRAGPRARRILEKIARTGEEKERGRAAAEIVERQLPKKARGEGDGTARLVVIDERAMKILADALKERRQVGE